MTLIVVAVTFLAALAAGGKIRDLDRTEIRHVWVFPLALVLMILLNYAQFSGWLTEAQGILAQPSIYLVIIAGIMLNAHIPGAKVLALGTFLNFLVIALNKGYMPVSMTALKVSGLTMKELEDVMYLRHMPMDQGALAPFLGDIIPVPWPPLLRSVGSVGDLVVIVGLVLVVWGLFFPHGRRAEQPAARAA